MTEFIKGDIVRVNEDIDISNINLLGYIGKVIDTQNSLIGVQFTDNPTGDTNITHYYFLPKSLTLVESTVYHWFFFEDKSNIPTNPQCCYETKEQAIQAGISCNLKHFYVGKVLRVYPQLYSEDILELLRAETDYLYGTDDYLHDVSEEAMTELENSINDVLSKWYSKYNYFIDVEEITR